MPARAVVDDTPRRAIASRDAVAVRDTFFVAGVAVRDIVVARAGTFCVAVRDTVVVPVRAVVVRAGTDTTVPVLVVPRGKTVVAVRAETSPVFVAVVRGVVSRTTTPERPVDAVSRLRTDDDAPDVRDEVVVVSLPRVDVDDVWRPAETTDVPRRDTPCVLSVSVAAMAPNSTHAHSARKHVKINLIPFIPYTYIRC